MSEINYFSATNDWSTYSASTAYTNTTNSQVTYTSFDNNVIYKGVNVIVNIPKRGDAVYAYSGVTDKPVFIAGETLKTGTYGKPLKKDGTEDSNYTPVGVVISVKNKQVLILYYKESSSNLTWNATNLSGDINTALDTINGEVI